MSVQELNTLIQDNGWLSIPTQITTREGFAVNSANENWALLRKPGIC